MLITRWITMKTTTSPINTTSRCSVMIRGTSQIGRGSDALGLAARPVRHHATTHSRAQTPDELLATDPADRPQASRAGRTGAPARAALLQIAAAAASLRAHAVDATRAADRRAILIISWDRQNREQPREGDAVLPQLRRRGMRPMALTPALQRTIRIDGRLQAVEQIDGSAGFL
jgi:hypothetical protein